ncbi:MAG: ATP-dependent DNA helicase [Betaproteobacteria bacterium]
MKYTVAVRTLCEFTAKLGDLDLRFTPSATALEGMAGHAMVAARRGESYESEVWLKGEFGDLVVRGRADGFDPEAGRLDEVKTYRGDLAAMPLNRRSLHWAQAKVYGALLCAERGLATLKVALVYFDVASLDETFLVESFTAAELQAFYATQCERFLAWAAQETAHRGARDAALASLPFPYATFRTGQRQLAENVYKAAISGRTLLAQAPTGIGKTVGTLYPQLKAMPGQKLDKLFFLAAKTPGRALALEALRTIAAGAVVHAGEEHAIASGLDSAAGRPAETARVGQAEGESARPPRSAAPEQGRAPPRGAGCGTPQPGVPLRIVELVAREKACEHPDKACHGDSCPLAKGFYDRLPAARQAAVGATPDAAPRLDRGGLRRIALQHDVCPYYLAQELVRWADVVVGDYNYYFDLGGMLHGLAHANDWRVGVLVDEAHNLVPRAREMYSATLSRAALDAVRPRAPTTVAPALKRLARTWNEITGRQLEPYAAYEDLPQGLVTALQNVNSAIGDHSAAHPADVAPELLAFYFDTLHFTRLAESFGKHSLFDLTIADDAQRDVTLCIRNLVPASFLKPRFLAARTTTLFSATLTPMHFHADLLGLPPDVAWVDVESPFDASQLRVQVTPLSTRFAHRPASLAPIVELMARQFARQPGNYLAFFSSFDYLQQVAELFRQSHPDVPVWEQARSMNEAARSEFLERFQAGGRGIGFAVLGGAFAEAVDQRGQRLIGAFIATLGLPQVNPVNEQMKARLETLFGAGHDYTYLYPGLQKVVQAAGRVIRTTTDEGVVFLIDDRFRRPEVRSLLPAWWRVTAPGDER